MIIAVDFDGTLCRDAYPDIGAPNVKVINKLKFCKARGAKVILWTCRSGDRLDETVVWCHKWGIHLDAINENLPEQVNQYGGDARKVNADEYWDDKNVMLPLEDENSRYGREWDG